MANTKKFERVCPDCGKTFTGGATAVRCKPCAYAHNLETMRENRRRERLNASGDHNTLMMSNFGQYSESAIRQATVKPKHMSDVRWRIELRRRAKANYFDGCMNP